jgi:hypothetical protein
MYLPKARQELRQSFDDAHDGGFDQQDDIHVAAPTANKAAQCSERARCLAAAQGRGLHY